jgi:hypothetical protein
MGDIILFKERVRQVAIREAVNYKNMFIDYNYLICLDTPSGKKHYVISGEQDNYAHLLGINTLCSPDEFFVKCMNGSLVETDFNFIKNGQNEEEVKGTVRRKINSIDKMKDLFSAKVFVEESFCKNRIICAIAATDLKITVGFSSGEKSYPKTLLNSNKLSGNAVEPILILRKKNDADLFSEVIYGNEKDIDLYVEEIGHLLFIKDKID